MIYESIYNIGKRSAKIILGGDSFGSSISPEDSFRMMDAYLSLGGNHIDTAHLYGIGSMGGEQICERTIGDWMRARKNRADIIISTKGAHPRLTSMHTSRLSKEEIRQDLEESLLALGTDYIDLYWLHRDNPNLPAGEILEWMNDFSKEGKILAFGASNWTGARLGEAEEYALAHQLESFSASQILFSAALTSPARIGDDTLVVMDETELQYYRKKLLPVFGYSSQAKGYFAKISAGRPLGDMTAQWFQSEENRRRATVLMEISEERGVSISALSMSYLMSCGVNGFPIAGVKTMEQLKDSFSQPDLLLTPDEIERIEGKA